MTAFPVLVMLDHQPATEKITYASEEPDLGDIISLSWATSSRYPGRHHLGLRWRLRRNPQPRCWAAIPPPPVCATPARRSAAWRRLGLKSRIPSRAKALFMRLMTGAFADQRLALTARPPGVFHLERRDRRHRAMAALTPQPAQKSSFQQTDIQPVGLGSPMFARHRHAGDMNDVGLDAAPLAASGPARSRPARLRRRPRRA